MSYTNRFILCLLVAACCSVFFVHPAHAFTANSLDIVVDKNGDATATFRFTLEGIVENAIPQSVLEDQLKKGLSTGSEPPDLISMDRSSAVLLLKKFADTSDVETGTEYRTETMDFKKAEVALQNSGLGGAVTADFTPDSVTVTFPDSYKKSFSNVDTLPAITHTVIDPTKTPRATAVPESTSTGGTLAAALATGSMSVNSSPEGVMVYVDSQYAGEASSVFSGIAPGVHEVEFRKDDYDPVSKNVTILAGKTTHVMVVLKYNPPGTSDESPSFPWAALLVVIIGLGVIAAGGYFWWSEKEKKERGGQGGAGQKTAANGSAADKKALADNNAAVKNSIVIRDITDIPAAAENHRPIPPREPPVSESAARNNPPRPPVVRTTQLADVPGMPPLPKESGGKKTVRNPTVVKVSLIRDIPDEKPAEDSSGEQDG